MEISNKIDSIFVFHYLVENYATSLEAKPLKLKYQFLMHVKILCMKNLMTISTMI